MENFDFDIKNYTIKNIEDFYKFNSNYTEDDINKKIKLMKEKLLNCKELHSLTDVITIFLNKSKDMLMLNIQSNHNLIPPKKIDINNVYNYKYSSGIVNPIERQVQTKSICINSLFRMNYFKSDSSSFDYIFPTTIENVISMRVSFVQIPIFWYNISCKQKNNKFVINVSNMQKMGLPIEDKSHTIIIEDGNYTSSALVDYLNLYFYNTGQGLNYLIVNINEINAKLVIRAKHPTDNDDDEIYPFDTTNTYYSPNFTFQVIFNDIPFVDISHKQMQTYFKSSANILGFKSNQYTVNRDNTYNKYSINSIYKAYLESDYPYGKYQHEYLFLEINDYQNNFTTNSVISLIFNDNYVSNNIIAVIPVTGNSNTIVYNSSSDGINKSREYFGPINLNKLSIRMLNQYGEPIDLNGYDYFTILEIQQLYNNYNLLSL
jgi:hypothetical protein